MTVITGDVAASDGTGTAARSDNRPPVPAFILRLRRWRPSVVSLLGVLIGFTFIVPSAYVVPGELGAAGRPSLLLGLLLLLVWVLIFLRSSMAQPVQPVRWLIAAYLSVWLVSVAIAYQRGLSSIEASGIERYLLITLSLTGIGLVTADLVPDRRSLDRLLRFLVCGGAFMGVVGLLQFQFRINLVELIRVPFLEVNDGGLIGLGERGGPGFARATATAAHSIEYGVLSAMLLPLAIHFALGAEPGRQRRKWWIAVGLVGAGILFSLSRSAVIGAVAVIIVLLRCWKGRGKSYLLGLGLVAMVATYIAIPGLLGTFRSYFLNTSNDPSIQGRTDDYQMVAALFGERPWFGLGGGAFRPEEYFILDNYILNALMGTGIFGLLTVLGLFFGIYGLGMRMLRRLRSAEDRDLAAMLAASAMAGFATSFTFDSLNFATFATTLFLLLGAAGALWRLRDSAPVAERDARYAGVVKTAEEAWPSLFRHFRTPHVASDEAPSRRARTTRTAAPPGPPHPAITQPYVATLRTEPASEPPVATPAQPANLEPPPMTWSTTEASAAPIEPAAAVPQPETATSVTDRGGNSFATALGWSAVMNIGRQAATLVITFVLAALLGPRQFGVVAMATVYIAFVQLLVQQGMGAAIIHRPNLSDDHLHTAFWMLGGGSVALAAVSAIGSGLWASLNGLPELRVVILALTPLVVLNGLLIVPDALLRRGMNFRPLALRTNVSVAIGGVIGIGAALAGWGVWALVAQQLSTGVLELVIVWAAVSWRPRFRWSPDGARELLSFTLPSSAAAVGVFVNNRADAFITGLLLGPTAVGLFRFASRLVETVVQAIMGSIRAVSLPELARHQRNPGRLARRVLDLTFMTSAAALIPLAALAAAGPAVIALAGDDWAPAVPALGLLAVAGAGRTISSLAGPTLQAIGRPGLLAVLTWVGAAFSSIALVVTGLAVQDADATTQVRALAVATVVLYAGVLLAIGLWALVACTEVTATDLAGNILTPVLAAAGGYLLGVVVDSYLADDLAPLVRAGVVGAAAAAQAGFVLVLLDPRARALLQNARGRLAPPLAPAAPSPSPPTEVTSP